MRAQLGPEAYDGKGIVGIHDVLRAHFLVLDYFSRLGQGAGGVGPRSINLLHSAVSRQMVGFEGRHKWKDDLEVCATLFYGLIADHPFYDGNKRTAFLVATYHLQTLGRTLTVAATEFERLALRTADHQLRVYQRFSSFAAQGSDGEVRFIADFFRRKTRAVDHRQYLVSYRQLDSLLRRHGFFLGQPDGNYIHVIRSEKRLVLKFPLPSFQKREQSVMKVGFPGWTREVEPGLVKRIRERTGLTDEKGIDSQVFFKGADEFEALIGRFHEPLERLADR